MLSNGTYNACLYPSPDYFHITSTDLVSNRECFKQANASKLDIHGTTFVIRSEVGLTLGLHIGLSAWDLEDKDIPCQDAEYQNVRLYHDIIWY